MAANDGPATVSFGGTARTLGWAQVGFAAVVALLLVLYGGFGGAIVPLVLAALLYGWLVYLFFVRPAVDLRADGVVLRGEVRDVRVPWSRVRDVEVTRSGLRVVTDVSVHAARGFGDAGRPVRGAAPGRAKSPAPSSGTPGRGAYLDLVAQQVRDAARRSGGTRAAEPAAAGSADVDEEVRWPLLAVAAALAAAVLVTALLA
jgi:hypothetical protein